MDWDSFKKLIYDKAGEQSINLYGTVSVNSSDSIQRWKLWQCSIYNETLKTFDWSKWPDFFIYFPWDTSNASVALSSHCTQHSLRLTGFDLWLIKVAEFKWFLRYLITELTLLDKHRRGTVVNQALPSLHEGLLKITILVPLNLPKVQWCQINSIHGFWITPLLLLSFI